MRVKAMPTGALAITARIFTSSSSLDWRIAAFWFSTCWNTRASSPSSPPARGQGSCPLKSSVIRRSARRSSWRSGRSIASVTSRITSPPATATAEPIQIACRRPAVGPPSSSSAGALRNTTQSASGTPAIATMSSPSRRAEPCGSMGAPSACHSATICVNCGSVPAFFNTHAGSLCDTILPSASATMVVTGSWPSIAGRVRSLSSMLVDSFMPPTRIALTWPSRPNSGIVIANIGVPLVRLRPGCEITARRSCTVRRM